MALLSQAQNRILRDVLAIPVFRFLDQIAIGDDTCVREAIEVNEVSEVLYIVSCFGGFEA